LEKLLSNHEAQNKGGRISAPIVVFLLTAYQLSPVTVEKKKSVLLAKHKDTNIPTMMEPFSPSAAWF
jgi:hypothetical protein